NAMRRDEAFERADHCRDAAFHVGAAAAVEVAIAQVGQERIAAPVLDRPARDHVGMADEHEHAAAFAVGRPEVAHVAERKVLDPEPGRSEALGEQQLATRIVWSDGAAPHEFAGEFDDLVHLPPLRSMPKRCLKPLSLKPWVTTPSAVTT